MEDYDFNRRLEALGPTLMIEDPPLVTSSRRFVGRRKWAIIAGWLAVHGLFHLGIPTPWLARLYDSIRRRRKGPDRITPWSAPLSSRDKDTA
jgi:hypothetical protein